MRKKNEGFKTKNFFCVKTREEVFVVIEVYVIKVS